MKRFEIVQEVGLGDDGPQVGEILTEYQGHDYGMRRDHEMATGGLPHVVIDRNGARPFFVVPAMSVAEYT